MKRQFIFCALLAASLFLMSCHYLDVPSFRLYIGYDLNPSTKLLHNDVALPKLKVSP